MTTEKEKRGITRRKNSLTSKYTPIPPQAHERLEVNFSATLSLDLYVVKLEGVKAFVKIAAF